MKTIRVAAAIPFLLLVTACGAAGTHNQAGSTSAADSVAPSNTDASLLMQPDRTDTATGTRARAEAPATAGPAIISIGQVSLRSKDITKTRFDLQGLLDGRSGSISSDDSSADADGRVQSERLVLRVPSARFDEAMTRIASLGRLTDQSRTSQDVTTKVIDNLARVRAQKLSLARMEALLARAKNLTEIIAIEGQLSTRQADLDSLQSQQKYLADQTTLSTITVHLSTTATAVHQQRGLLLGLERGWTALQASAVATLTAVGAVLPFSVLVALLGLPGWLALRRRLAQPRQRNRS